MMTAALLNVLTRMPRDAARVWNADDDCSENRRRTGHVPRCGARIKGNDSSSPGSVQGRLRKPLGKEDWQPRRTTKGHSYTSHRNSLQQETRSSSQCRILRSTIYIQPFPLYAPPQFRIFDNAVQDVGESPLVRVVTWTTNFS